MLLANAVRMFRVEELGVLNPFLNHALNHGQERFGQTNDERLGPADTSNMPKKPHGYWLGCAVLSITQRFFDP